MAGGNFVHRVISYVVNELVVNGLANRKMIQAQKVMHKFCLCGMYCATQAKTVSGSPVQSLFGLRETTPATDRFCRFAVRTSKRIEDISNTAVQKKRELSEQMKELSKTMEQNSKNQ